MDSIDVSGTHEVLDTESSLQRPVAAPSPGSHTRSAAVSDLRRGRVRGGGLADQIVSLPSPVRLQMSLIARSAPDSDAALAPVIDLLVEGSPAKKAAIVNAFRTNEPLREQWERTFEILRA